MSGNTIFRKTSLDRVSSPEQLNDYIKVSRPGVWLVLVAVVVLLIGVCVWGMFGSLTTTCDALTISQGGKITCYLSPKVAKKLSPGMELRVDSHVGNITSVGSKPEEITADFDAYALYLGGLKIGDWVVPVTADVSLPDGAYMGNIVLETIKPMSFVLN